MTDVVKEGRVARRILGDSTFQKAVKMADERFVEDWREAETVEDRERAHAKQAALDAVVGQLKTIADRGYVEENP